MEFQHCSCLTPGQRFLDFRSTLQITLGHVESNNDIQLSFISQGGITRKREVCKLCGWGDNVQCMFMLSVNLNYLRMDFAQWVGNT